MSGRLQLVIPFATVEPVKKSLSGPPRVTAGSDARFAARLADELAEVPVELAALLGRTVLSVRRILELEVGDVITLDADEGSPVPLLIEGRHKLEGQPRVVGGSNAIVLDQGLASEPRDQHEAA